MWGRPFFWLQPGSFIDWPLSFVHECCSSSDAGSITLPNSAQA